MKVLWWIAAGGALGAVSRFLVSEWVYGLTGHGFPWGTLVVNVVGSFLMGVCLILFLERFPIYPGLLSMILIGFLGAFTTFSTFSMDTLNLIDSGTINAALINMGVSVVSCLFAVWAGTLVARLFWP
ncbi:MAG: fluoride efflux transporter CrcB [Magnetococcales bacterium]|nr:fluoride efflux transporter CrcB [Magnetococcales bacterium]